MGLRADTSVVPVLMFHSVGLEKYPWVWSHLSEPVSLFEQKIALISRSGFKTVFWRDLYAHMAVKKKLPPNSIMLTFDDGYLDNWVYVYPILKKYGMTGTIFMTTDFIDSSTAPRRNLEDVWAGRSGGRDLKAAGFLNWSEMRAMEAAGVMDIQSHALTHTWYPSGPDIVDFHRPRTPPPYPWLFWNARPERKPFYLTEDQQTFIPWGYPVLKHEKSLVVQRFVPDKDALARLPDFVRSEGGRDFFARDDWRQHLMARARAEFGAPQLPGVYENDEERLFRIRHELAESKRVLESGLNKSVDFICWPGGGNDPEAQAIARDLGYKAWTLGSREEGSECNKPGADPSTLRRIGTANAITVKGRHVGHGDAAYQLMRINAHRGSQWARLQLRGRQLLAMVEGRKS